MEIASKVERNKMVNVIHWKSDEHPPGKSTEGDNNGVSQVVSSLKREEREGSWNFKVCDGLRVT